MLVARAATVPNSQLPFLFLLEHFEFLSCALYNPWLWEGRKAAPRPHTGSRLPWKAPGASQPPAPTPRGNWGQAQLYKQKDICTGKARATRDIPVSRGVSLNLPFSFDLHLSSLCCSASLHDCSFPSLVSLFFPEPDVCSTLELLLGAFKGV